MVGCEFVKSSPKKEENTHLLRALPGERRRKKTQTHEVDCLFKAPQVQSAVFEALTVHNVAVVVCNAWLCVAILREARPSPSR